MQDGKIEILSLLNELIEKCKVPTVSTIIDEEIFGVSTFVNFSTNNLLNYICEEKVSNCINTNTRVWQTTNNTDGAMYCYNIAHVNGENIDIYTNGICITLLDTGCENDNVVISHSCSDEFFELICNLYQLFDINSNKRLFAM